MKSLLFLIALVACLGGYIVYQRHHNYPFNRVATTAGTSYEVLKIPDACQGTTMCIKRVAYLTHVSDSIGMKAEAEGLLPWIDTDVAPGAGPHALLVIAIEPGFLKMSAPRRMVGIAFGKMPPDRWRYLGQEDMTAQLAPMFK